MNLKKFALYQNMVCYNFMFNKYQICFEIYVILYM